MIFTLSDRIIVVLAKKKNDQKEARLTLDNFPEERRVSFRDALIGWFRNHGRVLPWRETKDPYKIWLSEVILQQTQVIQGKDYYLRFIKHFPDVKALAEADEDEILLLWQGLGYYSRALNLHHAAQQIVKEYGGFFPRDPILIARLKGVGPYTTAAIMSIAYDYPMAVVDGNVYRVLSRVGSFEVPIDLTIGKKFFQEVADLFLDREQPSLYNQAMMDLGAMVCTPRQPLCSECPVVEYCESANRPHLISLLPIKAKNTKVSTFFMDFFFLVQDESFYVQVGEKKGIWKGLYRLPLINQEERFMTEDEIMEFLGESWTLMETHQLPSHRLTHRLLNIRVHMCEGRMESTSHTYKLQPIAEHHQLAFPRPLRQFLDTLFPHR